MTTLPPPFYHRGDIVIYHADCLDLLPLMPKVDLVLTDPPYGVEGGHGGQLRDYRKADYGNRFVDAPEYIAQEVVPVIRACLLTAKTVVVTPGTRCCCLYPQPDEVGCFFSPASSRIGKFGFQTCHPIFYYGWYKNRGQGALATGIELVETAEKNGHPCPKPIKAWTWLLQRSCVEGATVLDPYLGSGTTAVACLRTGRKCIGIELEPKYCRIAADRCDRELDQLQLFKPADLTQLKQSPLL